MVHMPGPQTLQEDHHVSSLKAWKVSQNKAHQTDGYQYTVAGQHMTAD